MPMCDFCFDSTASLFFYNFIQLWYVPFTHVFGDERLGTHGYISDHITTLNVNVKYSV